ncbi:hypothetical protein DL95DRAFT_414566 [Leptodontidium sp. 2 PMI_412]|nr:hypothetical protein DL95DRAFT_414566 [Leptodontidium sp. 2 PMI_412]
MGFFDLNWKGKAKATPSSTTNHNTASLFSQSQPPPPPTPRWVQTPHWNQGEASSSSSSSRNLEPEPSEHSEKVRDMPKSHRKQKAGARRNTCEHKINCRLSNPRCCACLDRRPLTGAYFIYKDGRGLVPEGTRWENYCPGCEPYWAGRHGKGIPDPSSQTKPAVQPNPRKEMPSSSSSTAASSLKPEQQPEPQVEPNEPPPPYSPSASSDGWEILPSYGEAEEEYGGGKRNLDAYGVLR